MIYNNGSFENELVCFLVSGTGHVSVVCTMGWEVGRRIPPRPRSPWARMERS